VTRVDELEIRPYRAADATEVARFYGRLSAEGAYTRFLCAGTERRRAYTGDEDCIVLVAARGNEIVAVGECCVSRAHPERAEVAFAVLDSFQHHGLGTRLLRELRPMARRRGVREFSAQVLMGNEPMMDVFRHSGLRPRVRLRDGLYDVVLGLE
jgi:GNAT superfamily N-acetyltransferase